MQVHWNHVFLYIIHFHKVGAKEIKTIVENQISIKYGVVKCTIDFTNQMHFLHIALNLPWK
jgi:hypothetical protein